ncbi:electron transfer flavoprotein subunit beta/FixA family protein [Ornithinimicrobium avium]|uniref:Electron transfer flavoprotein subunit beta/FixA family protein n=1 Tax=Ornithinimicrobium avium TaxID=2283195 RepID=A0A345NQZ8_9MICO|nr:electron transfer flavoprotein subunit beta/FixA family protein [Ornithinimicrobium avium]AXH97456.1 electron transfer flavoprotein subunit beta/FixA family protein [Ornithinimicrobium avium]
MASINVLVCVKRAADVTGEVVLNADGTGLDGRYSGYAMSPHETAAVEIAVSLVEESGGSVTVLTLGDDDAVEQLRDALAVGADDAVHVEADSSAFGPTDVAAAIAEVVRARAASGTAYDLVLVGNDAADTGSFQVGIRLAYLLDRPVVAGVQQIAVSDGVATLHVGSAAGTETYEVGLPAVATVLEGGVDPRYPSIRGRMRAKKAPVEAVTPEVTPRGSGTLGLSLPPPTPNKVTVLGEGPGAAPAVVEVLRKIGVLS